MSYRIASSGEKTGKLTWLAGKSIVLLIVLNIILLGIGIGGLVGGHHLDNEVDKHHYISDLLAQVEYENFNLRDVQYRLITSVHVLSALCVVTSLIGGFSALCIHRNLLLTSLAALSVCIVLQAGIISYWISVIVELNEDLRGHFKGLLRQYSFSINTYSLGWDYVFIYFGCCGVDPVTSGHNDFQLTQSYWWNSWLRGSDVIPNACCKDVSIYTYLFLFNNDCTVYLRPGQYNTEGCYEYFHKMFKKTASITGAVLACVFVIEITAIALTVIMLVALAANRRFRIRGVTQTYNIQPPSTPESDVTERDNGVTKREDLESDRNDITSSPVRSDTTTALAKPD